VISRWECSYIPYRRFLCIKRHSFDQLRYGTSIGLIKKDKDKYKNLLNIEVFYSVTSRHIRDNWYHNGSAKLHICMR
jgi:hypothetical protein